MINTECANHIIEACNRIAQSVLTLAQVCSSSYYAQFEGDYTARIPPIAPVAELSPGTQVTPVVDVPEEADNTQPEPAADTNPAVSEAEPRQVEHLKPQQDAPVSVVSLEQVRKILVGLSQAGHTDKVRDLIQKTGVDRLSEVDPTKYEWLLKQAKHLGDAHA